MKKLLCTFGYGEHSKLLELSRPLMEKYAEIHSYCFLDASDILLDILSVEEKQRAYSWWKIPLFKNLMPSYDTILWVDADVVINKFEDDIATNFIDYDIGLANHNVNTKVAPNAGVLLLAKNMCNWFDTIWSITDTKMSPYWWEQCALHKLMGLDPDNDCLPSWEPKIKALCLDTKWNAHSYDKNGVDKNRDNFVHFAAIPNRYNAMLNFINQ